MGVRLRQERLEWRAVEDEVVVLDVERSAYLAANPTGALLWKALAEGTTRDDLVGLLVDAHDVAFAAAETDVDRFLDQLADRGLLEE